MARHRREIDHVVHRGELAPDDAVREGRVAVVLADPETGVRTSYGVLIRRRSCGAYQVRLTHDASASMWWIVAIRDGHVVTLGFRDGRRADCERVFDTTSEEELANAGKMPIRGNR
jgi:hypothetical protein